MTTATMPKQPPMPPKGLIGGHILSFRGDTRLGFLLQSAQTYGDVVRYDLAGRDVFQLNHPDLVQQILVKQVGKFRKSVTYKRSLSRYLGNGLLISDGDFWKRQRKLAQPAFHATRINAYADTMVDYTLDRINTWQSGETRDIADDMMHITLTIVSKTLFDYDITADSRDIAHALETLLRSVIADADTFIRLPKWIPTPHRRRRRQSIETLHGVVERLISERRASEQDRGDLMSMLLLAQDDEGRGMSNEEVRDEALTIVLAGHETTANALTWTFYLLSQHPAVTERLQNEVDSVLQGRTPTMDDLPNLPYTEQVFKEGLRLYPPAWGFSREANEPVDIGDYVIPQDSTAFVMPYVLHRDPRWFTDPETFDPERFSPEREADIPRYGYIPFGGGPRVCIGNGFAMMEARLILATIVQRYHLALAPGHVVEPEPLITLRPKYGMKMQVTAR